MDLTILLKDLERSALGVETCSTLDSNVFLWGSIMRKRDGIAASGLVGRDMGPCPPFPALAGAVAAEPPPREFRAIPNVKVNIYRIYNVNFVENLFFPLNRMI